MNKLKKKAPMFDKNQFEASLLVRSFAAAIVTAAEGLPVADVACGSGRNAFLLAQLGGAPVCVDKDIGPIQAEPQFSRFAKIKAEQVDFEKDPWPFPSRSLGGLINVHYLLPSLFPFFIECLTPGSYLLIETVPGCGGNYIQLPRSGELRYAFSNHFEFLYYKERRVGPATRDAVVVRLVGRRNAVES